MYALVPHPFFGVLLNPTFIRNLNPAAFSGDVDLYTVPAGRRALVGSYHTLNQALTATTYFPEIKIGSTYYRVSVNASPASGLGITSPAIELILEAGDSFAVNVSQAGLNLFAQIIEFDANSPLKSARIAGPVSGDQVFYTVPVGKQALIPNFLYMFNDGGSAAGFVPTFVADGGGARTITWYQIPSGGTKGTATQSRPSATVNANTISSAGAAPAPVTMIEGDMLLLNVDVGNPAQFVWTPVIEM